MNYVSNIAEVTGENVQDIYDATCRLAKMSGWDKGYTVTPEAHKNIMKLAKAVRLQISEANDRKFILNQLLLNRQAFEKKLLKKHKFIKKKNFYSTKFDQEMAKLEIIAPTTAYTAGLIDELISCLHIEFNEIKVFDISFQKSK